MILVFDLSGVFFNNGEKTGVRRICKNYNLNYDDVEFVLYGPFAEKYRTGMMRTSDFWNRAKNYLKIEGTGKIRKIFFESYHPHKESVLFIKRLKSKNIKVGFLSNGPEDRTEFLDKKYNFISLFDYGLFSFEARAWKPDKKIYQKFLRKFKLKAEDIMYIDDRERDLKPAKELGMKTILFENPPQLKKDLKSIGLKF